MKIAGAELHQSYPLMRRTSSRNSSPPDSQKLDDSTKETSTNPGDANSRLPGENQLSSAKESQTEDKNKPGANQNGQGGSQKLDPKDLAIINELKKTDREVRAHEASHVAAGGKYVTGGPSYEYQTGPDRKQYAVGGEVEIDTSPVPDDPAATIVKMQVVKRAALAPANPSSQDRSVAAAASRAESEARLETKNATKSDKKDSSQNADKNQAGSKIDRRA